MKKAIIHLSDIHISDFDSDGAVLKSRFDENDKYKNSIVENINEFLDKNKAEVLSLVITGDLANASTKEEYCKVKEFIDFIVEKLKIKKDRFLFIPGNHDVNWSITRLIKDEGRKDYKVAVEKYRFYEEFIKSFYDNNEEHFESDRAICSKFIDEEQKIMILGLNSNFKISHLRKENFGYIDYDKLEEDLIKIRESNHSYEQYKKIAIFHHRPKYTGTDSGPVIENWNEVYKLLKTNDVLTYFFGHTHHTEDITLDGCNYFQCGSLGKSNNSITNGFNIYLIDNIKNNNEMINIDFYVSTFKPDYTKFGGGIWKVEEKKIGIPISCNSNVNKNINFEELEESKEIFIDTINDTKVSDSSKMDCDVVFNKDDEVKKISIKILKIVEEKKLYKSGHFHWNIDSRCHGWINTSELIGRHKYLSMIVQAFNKLIEINNIEFDAILGLGMEGNIIGTNLALSRLVKYSYCPTVYSKDHSLYEKSVDIKGVKKIVLVTDVLFEGSSITNLLDKRKDIFDKVEQIHLISIFDIGRDKCEILKFNEKVSLYSIVDEIKINKCNHDNPQNCMIFTKNLDVVYVFE